MPRRATLLGPTPGSNLSMNTCPVNSSHLQALAHPAPKRGPAGAPWEPLPCAVLGLCLLSAGQGHIPTPPALVELLNIYTCCILGVCSPARPVGRASCIPRAAQRVRSLDVLHAARAACKRSHASCTLLQELLLATIGFPAGWIRLHAQAAAEDRERPHGGPLPCTGTLDAPGRWLSGAVAIDFDYKCIVAWFLSRNQQARRCCRWSMCLTYPSQRSQKKFKTSIKAQVNTLQNKLVAAF